MQQLSEDLKNCKILIVDDEPVNTHLLKRVLAASGFHNFRSTNDSRQALPLFQELAPDLVVLDLSMPYIDGFTLLQEFCSSGGHGQYLPILILTANISSQAKQRALSLGARDFLTKPLDIAEVRLRIKNLLETRLLHQRLHDQNVTLEERVRQRTQELEEAQFEILDRLARAAEYRDDQTGAHTRRVGMMSEQVALALGLSVEKARIIGLAARLHDIGKIGIPDSILRKPGPLSPRELALMREHTRLGASILSGSRFHILQMAESIALTHHERFDGSGYTPGLGGEAIPIEGRIVAVVDAFDAMVNDRPYRGARTLNEAIDELQREAGKQFDPRVVAAFLAPGALDLGRMAAALRNPGEVNLTLFPEKSLAQFAFDEGRYEA
jgi:putative two-component system response regulator